MLLTETKDSTTRNLVRPVRSRLPESSSLSRDGRPGVRRRQGPCWAQQTQTPVRGSPYSTVRPNMGPSHGPPSVGSTKSDTYCPRSRDGVSKSLPSWTVSSLILSSRPAHRLHVVCSLILQGGPRVCASFRVPDGKPQEVQVWEVGPKTCVDEEVRLFRRAGRGLVWGDEIRFQ